MTTTVKSIIFVAVLALIGFGAYFLISSSEDETSNANNAESTSQATAPTEDEITQEQVTISAEEVAQKNSAQECWTIIDGSVYDITSYVPRHPGGDEILLACGTDGSSLFNERKTESGESIGSGTPHSSGAANQLNSYFIGVLEG